MAILGRGRRGLLVYWLMFSVLALGSLIYQQRYRLNAAQAIEQDPELRRQAGLVATLIALTLLIGLRYRVGGDWNVYSYWFREIPQWPLRIAIQRSPEELGYTVLNWIVARAGGQFWLVNICCAVPFMAGLSELSRRQPNPWLALTAAASALIIVVGMGYTRQASAMGFLLIGLAGLSSGRGYAWFFGWTLLGALFHQSVLVFILLVPLFVLRLSIFSLPLLIGSVVIGYLSLRPHLLDRYAAGYVNQIYIAKGALFRIAPNAVAGSLLLLFRRQFEGTEIELKIWRGFAYIALVIQGAYFFVTSTVALDRLSVYILPLQVWVWSKLPTAFGHRREPDIVLTMVVIGYSAASLWLWLTFANHSQYWMPYRLYPVFAAAG
jgi:hypothetical protein